MKLTDAIEENVLCMPNCFGELRPLEVAGVQGRISPISSIIASYVACARLSEQDADRTIRQVLDTFIPLRQEFGWWVTPNSRPADLSEHLLRAGFTLGFSGVGMALAVENAPALSVRAGLDVVRAAETELDELIDLMMRSYPMDRSLAAFTGRHFLHPDSRDIIEVYIARDERSREGLGYGVLMRMPDTRYAFFWGSAVLSEHRGRGAYSGLVARRLLRARELGMEHALVVASRATTFPICQALGFREVCPVDVYGYQPPAG